ncbi:MAG: hypothetical protein GWO24_12300, partial [Akkermansiaceae bacterium]|nr:hypothetical protein [Akkermansiaceae bacterium]
MGPGPWPLNPERAIAKLLASLCALLAACDPSAPEPKGPPAQKAAAAYVGSDVCRECHSESFGAWQGSHHDRAMETASEASVYGNFDDARFE